jgi:OmpA-OmpF porin, OOP family
MNARLNYICKVKNVIIRYSLVPLLLLCFTMMLQAQDVAIQTYKALNTQYDELNPVLSPDGRTLYFTVANHPLNVGGKRDPGDIWMSTLQAKKWSPPVHGGHLINDRAYNAVAGVSSDGNELYLLSHYGPDGAAAKTQGISVVKRAASGWGRPHNIVIPYFQNKSTFLTGTLSHDLNVLIFSAETYGTYGVDDLYVTTRHNGKWTEPRNLGSTLNTQFQELTPSISRDGMTLFFSSNGQKGLGSFDVFSANRLDDTWTNWSAPVNLGSPINSEGRELFFRDYPELGMSLMTSTKNSDGYGDLRFHGYDEPVFRDTLISQNLPKADTIFAAIDYNPVLIEKKKNTLRVYGSISNSKTGEPVVATVMFATSDGEMTTTSAANGYAVEIIPSESYSVRIEAPGFISALEKLDITNYETPELEMNFKLQPVEVGTTVNLRSVLFVQTKADLLPESYDELDMVVSFLKTNPAVKIELSGHTDNRGVHGDNVRLSQQRVNTVKQYLVSKGIDSKRISGKGHGGTNPIASNDSEETRKMNRRVEFIIKKF